MDNDWKSYFSFTKKERIGIITLMVLIGISTAVPYLWPAPSVPDAVTREALNARQAAIAAVLADTMETFSEKRYATKQYPNPVSKRIEYFRFNPNKLDFHDWQRLGLSERTARGIINYVQKGGRFRKKEDLKKMYSLRVEDYEKLAPYVDIPVMEERKRPVKEKVIIDVNTADTAAFIELPGIGPALARRIVSFREKLGGFYNVQQLGETYGLPDSTFQMIKTQLTCSGVVKKININTADAATLKQHPYIKWPIANAIVQYRQQHGPYRSVEDLQKIALISPELFNKIVVYVTVE